MDLKHLTRNRFAFIIPVFNHQETIGKVIEQVQHYQYPIFVVNDGSTDQTPQILQKTSGITILNHTENLGKGAALKTGFKAAAKTADWAITLDADGQHNPQDAEKLIKALENNRRSVVVGVRKGMDGENVPWTSRSGRMFSNFWVLTSGGPWLQDTQSGFRIYPIPDITLIKTRAQRYQFEVEILVKAKWMGMPVKEVPISVHYAPGEKRVSHFKPFVDFMRNATTFTRLITQRILIPSPIRKRLTSISQA